MAMNIAPQGMPRFVVDDDQTGILAQKSQDGKTTNNKSGWLWKRRDYIPGSRKRFFVLKETKLSYHSSPPETTHAVPRASFDLKGCFAAMEGDEPMSDGARSNLFFFRISFPFKNKQIFLGTETAQERDEWMAAVQCAIILNHFIDTSVDTMSQSPSQDLSGQSTIEADSYNTNDTGPITTPDAGDLSDDPAEDASPGPVALWGNRKCAFAEDDEDDASASMSVDPDQIAWVPSSDEAQTPSEDIIPSQQEVTNEPWATFYAGVHTAATHEEACQDDALHAHSMPLHQPSSHIEPCEGDAILPRPMAAAPRRIEGLSVGPEGITVGGVCGARIADTAAAVMAVLSALHAIFARPTGGGRRGKREWLIAGMRLVWAMYLTWLAIPRRQRLVGSGR